MYLWSQMSPSHGLQNNLAPIAMYNYEPSAYQATPLLSPTSSEISQLLGHCSPDVLKAYVNCQAEEERLLATGAKFEGKPNSLVYVRVLGWMFVFATSDATREELANSVLKLDIENLKYDELGKFFVDFWIRIFRKNKGRSSLDTGDTSRPSFDTKADLISQVLEAPSQTHSVAKNKALIRDGFRCVLCHLYDTHSLYNIRELQEVAEQENIEGSVVTNCSHIIASSTNLNIEDVKKRGYSANAWAVLQSFGYEEMLQELNGDKIHRLENVLTLHSGYHDAFGNLKLWFEPTNEGNCYTVKKHKRWTVHGAASEVKFEDHSQIGLSLPSKKYLGLHATCAKVAHMSGAAEVLDKLDRESEERPVLASDGSSVHLLNHLLTIESQRAVF